MLLFLIFKLYCLFIVLVDFKYKKVFKVKVVIIEIDLEKEKYEKEKVIVLVVFVISLGNYVWREWLSLCYSF